MEYILSEEEMQEIRELKQTLGKRSIGMPSVQTLQTICTKIANEWKTRKCYDGEMVPWGCILTVPHEYYCDDCPVLTICPHPHKRWPK
jgi:hypothetical protein